MSDTAFVLSDLYEQIEEIDQTDDLTIQTTTKCDPKCDLDIIETVEESSTEETVVHTLLPSKKETSATVVSYVLKPEFYIDNQVPMRRRKLSRKIKSKNSSKRSSKINIGGLHLMKSKTEHLTIKEEISKTGEKCVKFFTKIFKRKNTENE